MLLNKELKAQELEYRIQRLRSNELMNKNIIRKNLRRLKGLQNKD